ncbi:MAG: hypothetical protein AAF575_00110 [Bacteroidota bacterium]
MGIVLATFQRVEDSVFDLTGITFDEVDSIFRSLEIDYGVVIYASLVLGAIATIVRIIVLIAKVALRPAKEGEDPITLTDFFQVILQKWYFILIILAAPVSFSLLDGILASIFSGVNDVIGYPEGNINKALAKQLAFFAKNEPTIWDLSVGDIVDYTATLALQPALILIEQWIYGLALVYRFGLLGVVKLTSGIALVSLLHPETRNSFFVWLKALIISYLLIPAFLFMNAFVDAIKNLYITEDRIDWLVPLLIVMIAAKILLFASSKIILWRIM